MGVGLNSAGAWDKLALATEYVRVGNREEESKKYTLFFILMDHLNKYLVLEFIETNLLLGIWEFGWLLFMLAICCAWSS